MGRRHRWQVFHRKVSFPQDNGFKETSGIGQWRALVVTSEAGQRGGRVWEPTALEPGQTVPLGSSLFLGMGRRTHVGVGGSTRGRSGRDFLKSCFYSGTQSSSVRRHLVSQLHEDRCHLVVWL